MNYERQGEKFLQKFGIEFKAERKTDHVCPMWCDGKHTHGDRYLITFRRKYDTAKQLNFAFWNSLADKENNKSPTSYGVLASMTKYDPETFDNFCGEYGYDTDSIKALKTYKAVCAEWSKIFKFFGEKELNDLREIN